MNEVATAGSGLMILAGLGALCWGFYRIRLQHPPEGPMRTPQLGLPVTDPMEKLGIARYQGWVALLVGTSLVLTPLVSGRDEPERAPRAEEAP